MTLDIRDFYGNGITKVADESFKVKSRLSFFDVQNESNHVFDGIQQEVHISLSSPQTFVRTQVKSLDAVPTAHHVLTVSGTYQLAVMLPALPGNLIATLYSDSFFIRPVRNEFGTVDFSCADMSMYPISGKEAFGYRWSGFFKPTMSSVYVIAPFACSCLFVPFFTASL